jgi:hypothetical protein
MPFGDRDGDVTAEGYAPSGASSLGALGHPHKGFCALAAKRRSRECGGALICHCVTLVAALLEAVELGFPFASTRQDGGSVEAARLEILERLLCVREGVFVGGHP